MSVDERKVQKKTKGGGFDVQPEFVIDSLLEANGIACLRLPPYGCEFNPIELVSSTVKSRFRRDNVDPGNTAANADKRYRVAPKTL